MLVVSLVCRKWRAAVLRSFRRLPPAGSRATAAALMQILLGCDNLEAMPPAAELPPTIFTAGFWETMPILRLHEVTCIDPKLMTASALVAYESWLKKISTVSSITYPLSGCVRLPLSNFTSLTRLTLVKSNHQPHLLRTAHLPRLTEVVVMKEWGDLAVIKNHCAQLTSLSVDTSYDAAGALLRIDSVGPIYPSLTHLTLRRALLERYLRGFLLNAPALKSLALSSMNVVSEELMHQIEPLLVEFDAPLPDIRLCTQLKRLTLHWKKHPNPCCWPAATPLSLHSLRITAVPSDDAVLPDLNAPNLTSLNVSFEQAAPVLQWLLQGCTLPCLSHLTFAIYDGKAGPSATEALVNILLSNRFPRLSVLTVRIATTDDTPPDLSLSAPKLVDTVAVLLPLAWHAGIMRVELPAIFSFEQAEQLQSCVTSPWVELVLVRVT